MKYRILNVKATIDNDEYILLNMANGKFYGLDNVGSEIWKMIEDGNEFNQIVDNLHEKYGEDKERINEDIKKYIDKLTKSGLVRQY
ncbi:PqqD family protein [Brevibacillus brevis]|nr:PqqD family protein [Brevibacillus brevis]